ncbi:hypothetical protein ACWGII_30710 [Streptomyces sp. NPDC054855]
MPLTSTTSVTDLDNLVQQTAELEQHGRALVVPKIPARTDEGSPLICRLTSAQVTGETFWELALHAGARIVYAEFDVLDANDLLKEAEEDGVPEFTTPDRAKWRALQQRIRAHHGRCAEAELGFSDGAVLITWSEEADWASEIGQEVEELWRRYEAVDESVSDDRAAMDGPFALQRPSREDVAKHAAHLARLPEFRSAGHTAERRRVAERAIPELAADDARGVNYLGHLAVGEAGFLVENDRKKAFAQMAADLPALARRLTDEGVLEGASGARSRARRVKEALQDWSGGYRPPMELAEDVEAFMRKAATGRQMTMV